MRIAAFAPNAWDGPWMNRQQLLSRLAHRGHEVIYSTGLWTVWDRARPDWKAASAMGNWIERDDVHVDLPPKWLLGWQGSETWTDMVTRIGAGRWRRMLDRLGADPTIAYIFHPTFLSCSLAIEPDYLVFHAYDMFWNQSSDRQRVLHRDILKRADLVIASSESIAQEQVNISGRNDIRVLPNGADVEAFTKGASMPVPDDIAPIPRPRILYAGNLNRKVDFSMIAELATRRQDWHFVLVGDIGRLDAETAEACERCRQLGNVHFLGAKHHSAVPAYTGHADVNIMIYRQRDDLWTVGGYPLKLHEYLAAGKPIVTAPLPALEPFEPVLAFAQDTADWEAQLARALEQGGVGTPSERYRIAARNSWEARADQLEQWFHALAQ